MYESQKKIFEDNILRSELKVVPGQWWLTTGVDMETLEPREGKCCALSPSLIGKKILEFDHIKTLASFYDISEEWIGAALVGFDSSEWIHFYPFETHPDFDDGYRWGQEMRKYIALD